MANIALFLPRIAFGLIVCANSALLDGVTNAELRKPNLVRVSRVRVRLRSVPVRVTLRLWPLEWHRCNPLRVDPSAVRVRLCEEWVPLRLPVETAWSPYNFRRWPQKPRVQLQVVRVRPIVVVVRVTLLL